AANDNYPRPIRPRMNRPVNSRERVRVGLMVVVSVIGVVPVTATAGTAVPFPPMVVGSGLGVVLFGVGVWMFIGAGTVIGVTAGVTAGSMTRRRPNKPRRTVTYCCVGMPTVVVVVATTGVTGDPAGT